MSLTFPPAPLGWSNTFTSTPRAIALLTWFKLAADDMSSLYLSAKNLHSQWHQQRAKSSRVNSSCLLFDGRSRNSLTSIRRGGDTFLRQARRKSKVSCQIRKYVYVTTRRAFHSKVPTMGRRPRLPQVGKTRWARVFGLEEWMQGFDTVQTGWSILVMPSEFEMADKIV